MSRVNFYVIQTQGSFRNEIGEMTETEVYGHVGTRLGREAAAADVLRELQEKGVAIAPFTDSTGLENTMEIRRLAPNETVYGHGTHVPCRQCGRRIFLQGPVEVELRDGERWVKLQCKSPTCALPRWYPEVALEIHGNS